MKEKPEDEKEKEMEEMKRKKIKGKKEHTSQCNVRLLFKVHVE